MCWYFSSDISKINELNSSPVSLTSSTHYLYPAFVTHGRVTITVFIIIIIFLIANQTHMLQVFISPQWSFVCAPTVLPAPPKNLRIVNATTTSLMAKWDPAPTPVQNYKITYKPVTGGEPLTVSCHLVFTLLNKTKVWHHEHEAADCVSHYNDTHKSINWDYMYIIHRHDFKMENTWLVPWICTLDLSPQAVKLSPSSTPPLLLKQYFKYLSQETGS